MFLHSHLYTYKRVRVKKILTLRCYTHAFLPIGVYDYYVCIILECLCSVCFFTYVVTRYATVSATFVLKIFNMSQRSSFQFDHYITIPSSKCGIRRISTIQQE